MWIGGLLPCRRRKSEGVPMARWASTATSVQVHIHTSSSSLLATARASTGRVRPGEGGPSPSAVGQVRRCEGPRRGGPVPAHPVPLRNDSRRGRPPGAAAAAPARVANGAGQAWLCEADAPWPGVAGELAPTTSDAATQVGVPRVGASSEPPCSSWFHRAMSPARAEPETVRTPP